MERELKKCPFCGGEAKINSKTMDGMIHIWVDCKECHSSSPIFSRSSHNVPRKFKKDDVWLEPIYEAWNRRVSND